MSWWFTPKGFKNFDFATYEAARDTYKGRTKTSASEAMPRSFEEKLALLDALLAAKGKASSVVDRVLQENQKKDLKLLWKKIGKLDFSKGISLEKAEEILLALFHQRYGGRQLEIDPAWRQLVLNHIEEELVSRGLMVVLEQFGIRRSPSTLELAKAQLRKYSGLIEASAAGLEVTTMAISGVWLPAYLPQLRPLKGRIHQESTPFLQQLLDRDVTTQPDPLTNYKKTAQAQSGYRTLRRWFTAPALVAIVALAYAEQKEALEKEEKKLEEKGESGAQKLTETIQSLGGNGAQDVEDSLAGELEERLGKTPETDQIRKLIEEARREVEEERNQKSPQ